jgi:hypothetical protein
LTKKEYSKIDKPSAQSCGCGNCLNYVDSREKLFLKEIIELLNQLGINELKEIEISHMAKLENGLHYYFGWFYFIGKFNGKDCSLKLPSGVFTIDFLEVTENFGIRFTKAKKLSVFESNQDLVPVESDCKIPWVIDKIWMENEKR